MGYREDLFFRRKFPSFPEAFIFVFVQDIHHRTHFLILLLIKVTVTYTDNPRDSSIKRVLDEDLFSKFFAQMVESCLKIMLYNIFMSI
jgi:hypothetical protein